jgi:hypothetical protein
VLGGKGEVFKITDESSVVEHESRLGEEDRSKRRPLVHMRVGEGEKEDS